MKGRSGVCTRAPFQGLVSGHPFHVHPGGTALRLALLGSQGWEARQSLAPGVPGLRGRLQPGLPAGQWSGSSPPSSGLLLVSGIPSLKE